MQVRVRPRRDVDHPRRALSLLLVGLLILAALASLLALAPTTTAISYRAASSATSGSSTTSSLSITMPGGTVENDVMVAQAAAFGGTGTTITAPTGWRLIHSVNSTTALQQAIFYKVAGSGESGPFDFGISPARKTIGGIVSIQGADTNDPIDAVAGQANAASTSVTAPAVTTTVADAVLIGFFSTQRATSFTAPTGMTERYDAATSGGSSVTGESATVSQATAGSSGAKVATAGNAVNIGHLVAIAPPSVAFSSAATSGSEASTSVSLSVALSGASSATTTVGYTVSGASTASAGGVDHDLASGTLSISAGASSGSISFTVNNDAFDEASETVIVTLSSPTNANLGATTTHTYTITDDDPTPSVTLSLSGSAIAENGGTGTVTATLSAASSFGVTVDLAYTGTAAVTSDYTRSADSISIAAGATTGSVTLTGVQDTTDEPSETIIVDVSDVTNAVEATAQQVTASIVDDDLPTVTLEATDAAASETGPDAATFTLTRMTEDTGVDLAVLYGITGTATPGADYNLLGGTVTIPGGSTTATITLTPTDDALDEADETATLTLSSDAAYTVGSPSGGTATITDDDPLPTVTLSTSASTLAEDGGQATVTATLSAASGRDVTVGLAFGGDATPTADYTNSGASLLIAAGALTATTTVTAAQDALDEPAETVTVDIDAVTNGAESGVQQVTLSIVDDDPAPSITLSVSGASAAEASGVATVTATLSAASGRDVGVSFTFGGSATLTDDFTASATSVLIPAGATTATITVTAVQDAIDELDETVTVDVASVDNGTESGTQQVTVTLVDDDATPTLALSLSSATLAEAAGATVVTGTLSAVSGLDVTATLAFTGTATPAADFTTTATTLLIPAGSTTGTVTLTAVQDALDEDDETILVDVDSVSNGVESGTQQVTAQITDDDATPTVTLGLAGSPAAEAGGTVTITASLSAASGRTVTIALLFGGSALVTDDYTRSGTSITILPGSTTGSVTLTGVDDTLDEPDETVVVDIDGVTHGVESGAQQVTATWIDDDAPPTVTLALAASFLAEAAGVTTATATLSAASGRDVTVVLSFAGSATVVDDYTRSASSVVIPAGATTGSVTLTAVQDALDELDETITVDVDTVTNGVESGTQQVTATIMDDDAAPTVTLSQTGSPMAEAAGVTTLTATLSAPSGLDVTVTLDFTGAAVLTDDYTRSGTVVVIPAGATTGAVTATAVQDALDEDDEVLTVDIVAVSNGAESGTQRVDLSILDDDALPTVTLALTGSPMAEEGGTATLTATLSTLSGRAVTVGLTFGGDALLTADYTRAGSSITIAAGSLTGTLALAAASDALDETDESIVVDIDTVTNGAESGSQQATASIVDDDATPTLALSLTGSPMPEAGGPATVTATLSAPSGRDVTASLSFAGTALLTSDYLRSGATILIAAGATTGTVSVEAVQDSIDEEDETVIIDVTGVTNATESGTQQVTATIADDDASPTVTLSLTGSPLAEDGGQATATATLSAASGLDVTIGLSFGGTADLTTDYARSGTVILVPAGAATGAVTVTGVSDLLDEPDETVVIDVGSVTNGVESGTQQVTATITDDDAPPSVTLETSSGTVSEAGGTATLTARLSAASGRPVSVGLSYGGTASVDEYVGPASLTIPAGDLTATGTLQAVTDAIDEPDETVLIDVASVTNGTESGTQQVTVEILDDDAAPTVTLEAASNAVAETGGSTTVIVRLSGPSGRTVDATLSFGGTATVTDDYLRSASSVTIAPGATTAAVTLDTVTDALDENDETILIDVATVTNATESGTQQTTVTITDDDDAPTVTLGLADSFIAEAGGTATATATLSAPSGLDVAVTLGFSGSADAPADYTRSATGITIPAGSTSGSITISAVQDALDENDETVVVDVIGVTNGLESGTQQVTLTVTDDDAPPTVTLENEAAAVAEAAGTSQLTARLSTASGLDVTVELTYGGTAGGTDYTRPATLTVPAGDVAASGTVQAVQDSLDEADETVIVSISAVTNGVESGSQQVELSITDDDAPPSVTISLDGATLAEAGGAVTLTAVLSAPSGRTVTVDLDFGGSATPTTDYTRGSTSIAVPAGASSASLAIAAVSDALDEIDESIVIDVATVTNGAESGTQQVTASILDDDAPPTVTLALSGSPMVETGGVATVTATLSGPSGLDVTVDLSFGGGASATADYSRSGDTIVIAAGDTTGAVTLTAATDALDEADESILVDVVAVANGTEAGVQQVTAVVTDDDDAPSVTLELTGSPFTESGGTATVRAVLSAVSGCDVDVALSFSGTAAAGADFTGSVASLRVPTGSSNASLVVTGVPDALDEAEESIIIDVDGVTNGTESGTQRVTAAIVDDDDPPTVALASSGSPLAEAGGVATVTLTLSAPSGLDVSIQLAYGGTATAADYAASADTLIVPAGATARSVTLTAADDALDELDETIIVDVASVTNGLEATEQRVVATITDDDATPEITLTASPAAIAEASGVATVTATLAAVSGLDVVVSLAYAGTATGADYTGSVPTLTIPAGSPSAAFALTATQDLLDEDDETIDVAVAGVTNGVEAAPQAIAVAINDDDPLPAVSLALLDASFPEAGGTATVRGLLDAPSGRTVTVTLAFTGTAGASDYSRTTATLTFDAGQTERDAVLTATTDALDEPDESVIIDVSAVTNAVESAPQQVTATLLDDDEPPTVALSMTGSPVAEALGAATVTATLSAPSGRDVGVDFAFGGDATPGADYTQSASSLLIPAGATTGSITLTSVADAIDEPDESVQVELAAATNATQAGPQQVTLIIADDDAPPSVTLTVTGSPVAEASGVAIVTATLSSPSGRPVTVELDFGGTATEVVDYSREGARLVIAPGALTDDLTLTAAPDALDELDETIVVTITSVTNGTEDGDQQAVAAITDDDAPPTVTLSMTGSPVPEAAGAATVTASLSAASGLDVTVHLLLGGTAVLPTDYTRSAASIQVPAGATNASIVLTAVSDALDEADESFTVDIDTVTNGAEAGTQRVTGSIVDDDEPPTVTISVSGSPLAETGATATVTVTLSSPSGRDVVVTLGFAGTATPTADYATDASTLTIPAGATSAVAILSPAPDALDEPDETILVVVEAVLNGTEATPQEATVTITDDDAPPTVTLSADTPTVAEAAGVATLTVALSQPSGKGVGVTLGVRGSASGDDYVLSAASVWIPAGSTNATLTVTAVGDALDELDETLIVDVEAVTNATETGTQSVTTTITDDDEPPAVALGLSGSSFPETGGNATLTVTLSAVSGLDVTVTLSFGGTASTPSDYAPEAAEVTIVAGDLVGTLRLTAAGDALDESDETVIIDIASVTNGLESGTQQATATLTDDDDPPLVTLSASPTSFDETGGVATLTATLSNPSSFPVRVLLTFGGPAQPTTDYTRPGDAVLIAAGAGSGSLDLVAVSDALDEADEEIVVAIASVDNGTESGSQEVTLVLLDDDAAPVLTLSSNLSSMPETGGLLTITGTLSAASALDVTATLAFNGTATQGVDYGATGSSLLIAAGSTSASIQVDATADDVDEPDETVVVEIASLTNAAGAGGTATVAIEDDDGAPSVRLEAAAVSFAEAGGTVDVTVILSAPSSTDVLVNLTFSGAATLGTDYEASAASLTVPAGSTTATLTLTGLDDAVDEANEGATIDIDAVTNGLESGLQRVSPFVTDDDPAPLVTLSMTGSPLAENGGSATVDVELSAVSAQDVTVILAFSGSAIEGSDYEADSATLNVPAGSVSASTTLTAINDARDEPDEDFTVAIASATNAVEDGVQAAAGNITDDDEAPTVSLALTGGPLLESGGAQDLVATLSGPSGRDVTVSLGFGGTATPGDDYGVVGSAILIPAGATNASLRITATSDLLDEDDEAIQVDVDAVTNADESGTQTVTATLIDDDDPPTVTLTLTGSPADEDGGVATVTATLSTPSGLDVTLGLTFSGSATSGDDYAAPPTGLLIPAGESSSSFDLTASPDALDEPTETVIVDLATVTNALEPAPQQVTLEIRDTDAPTVTVALSDGAAGENGPNPATFVIRRTAGDVSNALVVNVTLSGTATAGSDYDALPATVTIPAGAESQGLTLNPIDDADAEGPETVRLDVNPDVLYLVGTSGNATVTLVDNDVAGITVSPIGGLVTTEAGGTALFGVVLNTVPTADVAMTFTLSAPTEVTLSTHNVTFTAADALTEKTVIVTGLDDDLVDGDVSFTIGVLAATSTDPDYAGLEADDVAGTNLDDDVAGLLVDLGDGLAVDEGGSTDAFTVALTAQPAGDVSVDVTSLGPDEATTEPRVLTFTASDWATPRVVTVRGVDDDLVDGVQSASVRLSVQAADSSDEFDGVADRTLVVQVTDDDAAGFNVVESDDATIVGEPSTTDALEFTLTAEPAADVVLRFSNPSPDEVLLDAETLRFGPANWSTPQTLTVTGVDDAAVDGDQLVALSISVDAAASDDAWDGVAAQVVSVTNEDDDFLTGAIVVTQTEAATVVAENGTVDRVWVVLSLPPTSRVVVDVSSSDEGEATTNVSVLEFTPDDWDQAQAVEIRGADDADVDGNQTSLIRFDVNAAASSREYQASDGASVEATTTDDDTGEGSIVHVEVDEVEPDTPSTFELPDAPDNASASVSALVVTSSEGAVVAAALVVEYPQALADDVPPPPTTGPIAVYFDLELATADGAPLRLASAIVRFDLRRSWLDENCPSSSCQVRLYHYTGTLWETLVPTVVAETADVITYEATVTSLSPFAVGGQRIASGSGGGSGGAPAPSTSPALVPTTTPAPNPTSTSPVTRVPEPTLPTPVAVPLPTSEPAGQAFVDPASPPAIRDYSAFAWAGVFLGVAAAGALLFGGRAPWVLTGKGRRTGTSKAVVSPIAAGPAPAPPAPLPVPEELGADVGAEPALEVEPSQPLDVVRETPPPAERGPAPIPQSDTPEPGVPEVSAALEEPAPPWSDRPERRPPPPVPPEEAPMPEIPPTVLAPPAPAAAPSVEAKPSEEPAQPWADFIDGLPENVEVKSPRGRIVTTDGDWGPFPIERATAPTAPPVEERTPENIEIRRPRRDPMVRAPASLDESGLTVDPPSAAEPLQEHQQAKTFRENKDDDRDESSNDDEPP